MALPRFLVLRQEEFKEYLGYIRQNGEHDGFLSFMETKAMSPFARFEVEIAAGARANIGDLVHIRSCQNNRYWVRNTQTFIGGSKYWITATADKPEEDQSKESCTLFKFISVDPIATTVRIMHVQSGNYLCLWRLGMPQAHLNRCVTARYNVFDHNRRDIFTVIDWESLLFLPKYVAFKGDNDKYLCLRWIEGHPYMQFATEDIGDSTATFEIFVTHDGNFRIKPISSENFWRRSPNWIWADSNHGADTINPPPDTLFRPFKVDNHTIGLINLGNNNFCKRLTTEGKTNCLNASVPSVTREARLTVEEPVMTREIYDVRYILDYSRIYDERIIVASRSSATNRTQQTATLDVKLSYTETRTTTWKVMGSLKLGAKATFDVGLPLIFNGKIELSGEIQFGGEWGETTTETSVLEVVHKVVVPPMTRATVNLIATNGKCDVPFTFFQKDTLYNGKTVITEVQGGIFTGSNYYNFDFQTNEEKLQ